MTDYKLEPKSIVDELAQFIRHVDGNNRMGARSLADKICERFRVDVHDVQGEPLRYTMSNKDMPAYPLPISSTIDGFTGSNAENSEHGLTKLEAFTKATMQGLLSDRGNTEGPKHYARLAVDYAEAALDELAKRQSGGAP